MLVALFALLAVALTRETLLQAAGDFLVARDPLAPADAVAAISGNGPERVEEAARVFQDGFARWVIISGGPPGLPGSSRQMREFAVRFGVPVDRILIDESATSTVENAEGVARIMRAHGLRSAILVTSPYHMRRALVIFRAVFRQHGLTASATPVRRSFFDVHRWWTRSQDRNLVVREYVKLLAFLIGLRR